MQYKFVRAEIEHKAERWSDIGFIQNSYTALLHVNSIIAGYLWTNSHDRSQNFFNKNNFKEQFRKVLTKIGKLCH